jgi:hypothetical protein
MPPKNKGKKGKKGADDDEYWWVAIGAGPSVVSYSWQGESWRTYRAQFLGPR